MHKFKNASYQSEARTDQPIPGPFPTFPMTKREKPWERGCERARGKGNLRTKTITMYCCLCVIATVVLKHLKRVSILILSRL